MPSTKPEPVNTGTPTLSATPTTPDTTDSGETEQQRLDRLYPVGPDTRPDVRALYTTLRPGRQPTEDEWREYHARRRDEEQRERIHADGTVHRCQSAGRGDRPLRRVRDSAAGAHLAAGLPALVRGVRLLPDGAGLTVAQKRLQDGDYLLGEGSAQTFYPHPTPLQTGDSLLLESDGARYEPVQPNPGDFLLDEAPPCGRRAAR